MIRSGSGDTRIPPSSHAQYPPLCHEIYDSGTGVSSIQISNSARHEFINSSLVTTTKQFFFRKKGNGLTSYVKRSNTSDKREVTHLLLDGGNIHLSSDDMEEFYSCYANDLVCGRKNFIVEMKTPVFKYFMDLDILDHEFYEGKRLIKLVQTVQHALSFFFDRYDGFSGDVYICTSPPKEQHLQDTDYIKTGVHLIWPDVVVTTDIAIFLRQFVIQYVTAKLGKREEHNPWEVVFDHSVYESNGLRMIGSYKAQSCKDCRRNRDNSSCDTCKGLGKLYGNHTYTLDSILSTNRILKVKIVKELKTQQMKLIKLLSIRSNKFRANMDIKEPYPPWFNVSLASKSNKHIHKLLKPTRDAHQKTGGSNAVTISDTEIVDAVKTVLYESFRSSYPGIPEYRDIYIRSVRKPMQSKNECYWVTTDCRYCLNVGREHNSSTIYFKIDYKGIVAKCFSRKTTLSDRNITCSKFHSINHEISLKYKEILFPDLYTEQRKMQEVVYKLNRCKTKKESTTQSGWSSDESQKQTTLDDFLDNDDHDLFR